MMPSDVEGFEMVLIVRTLRLNEAGRANTPQSSNLGNVAVFGTDCRLQPRMRMMKYHETKCMKHRAQL